MEKIKRDLQEKDGSTWLVVQMPPERNIAEWEWSNDYHIPFEQVYAEWQAECTRLSAYEPILCKEGVEWSKRIGLIEGEDYQVEVQCYTLDGWQHIPETISIYFQDRYRRLVAIPLIKEQMGRVG